MKHTGFTLIEMLVVVLIIGILTSIGLPQYRRAIDRAKVAEALQLMPALFDARERWRVENGYQWKNNSICEFDSSGKCIKRYPSLTQLDIETKGYERTTGVLRTKNFEYWFKDTANLCNVSQKAIVAFPQWGKSQGGRFVGVTICFDGKKICCRDSVGSNCGRLNIEGCPGEDDGD